MVSPHLVSSQGGVKPMDNPVTQGPGLSLLKKRPSQIHRQQNAAAENNGYADDDDAHHHELLAGRRHGIIFFRRCFFFRRIFFRHERLPYTFYSTLQKKIRSLGTVFQIVPRINGALDDDTFRPVCQPGNFPEAATKACTSAVRRPFPGRITAVRAPARPFALAYKRRAGESSTAGGYRK